MKQMILLIIILILIGIPLLFNFSATLENYSNYTLDQSMGDLTDKNRDILVQDIYNPIGKNQISDDNSSDIWQHYPIFQLGSYEQITNNIRYPDNPDEGTCMPASMCGALYHEKHIGDNYVKQLPPVDPNCGTRVGYFSTDQQLVDSLPFRTNIQNVLY